MKDELWLKKIKDRLDDCQEPLPAGGWERLERELGQTGQSAFSPSRSKRIVVMRRWSVAAAAALLVAVSGISFWLLHSPAGEEMRRAEVPVVRPYDRMPEPAVEDEALARVDEPVWQERKPAVVASRKMEHVEQEILEENLSVVQDDESQDMSVADKSEEKERAAEAVVRSEVPHEEQVPAVQKKKKTSLDEPVVLPEPARKKNKGWAFGLSVGNNGPSLGNDGERMRRWLVWTNPFGRRGSRLSLLLGRWNMWSRKYWKKTSLLFRTTNHRTCLLPTSLKKRNVRRKLLSVRKSRMKNRFLPYRKRRRQVWMNRWCCPNRPGRKIRDGLSACQSGTTVRHWEMTVNGIW